MQTEQVLEPNTLLATNGSVDERKDQAIKDLMMIYEYLKDGPKFIDQKAFKIKNINVFLSEIRKAKIIVKYSDGRYSKYKWNTITPNYHMSSKLVDDMKEGERIRGKRAKERTKNAPDGLSISSRPVKIFQIIINLERQCGNESVPCRAGGFCKINREELEEKFGTLSNRVIALVVELGKVHKIRENKADFYYKWAAEKPTMELAHKLNTLLTEKSAMVIENNNSKNFSLAMPVEQKTMPELVIPAVKDEPKPSFPADKQNPSFTVSLLWGLISYTRWK